MPLGYLKPVVFLNWNDYKYFIMSENDWKSANYSIKLKLNVFSS